jgi:hypothetical protein
MNNQQTLRDLARSLRDLHHALVQVVRRDYEKQWGAVHPGELLQLLTRHPDFDWLHTLSEMMVGIDEMLDQDEVTADDVRTAVLAVRQTLVPEDAAASAFSSRYQDALQRDPALVVAHAGVRRILHDFRMSGHFRQ